MEKIHSLNKRLMHLGVKGARLPVVLEGICKCRKGKAGKSPAVLD